LILLAFGAFSDGPSVELELADITSRQYRLTPALNARNATKV
jgi:hypothetical protein